MVCTWPVNQNSKHQFVLRLEFWFAGKEQYGLLQTWKYLITWQCVQTVANNLGWKANKQGIEAKVDVAS